jgi:CheY-like chemotaxis protein
MDYRMPIMDGIECTRRIRSSDEDNKTIPIVALTANTDYASREMFRQNGFSDFLPKPIEMEKLNATIEKWIPQSKKKKIDEADQSATMQNIPEPSFRIPGVNVKRGIISTGGSLDIYLRVITKYYENGCKLLTELKECLEQNNIDLYRVHVHALNSLSESIGASKIAKAAEVLELASEEGDLEFIHSKNPKFLQELEILLENIQPIVTKESDDVMDTSSTENERKRVLIVDDTEAYLLILNDILKDDYETIIAMDGEDGLETARLTNPDLILMDIVMPGMSGYDVLKEIHDDKELKSIPVILISGKSAPENEIKGYSLGAVGYIKKPFDRDAVMSKVKTILGGM